MPGLVLCWCAVAVPAGAGEGRLIPPRFWQNAKSNIIFLLEKKKKLFAHFCAFCELRIHFCAFFLRICLICGICAVTTTAVSAAWTVWLYCCVPLLASISCFDAHPPPPLSHGEARKTTSHVGVGFTQLVSSRHVHHRAGVAGRSVKCQDIYGRGCSKRACKPSAHDLTRLRTKQADRNPRR